MAEVYGSRCVVEYQYTEVGASDPGLIRKITSRPGVDRLPGVPAKHKPWRDENLAKDDENHSTARDFFFFIIENKSKKLYKVFALTGYPKPTRFQGAPSLDHQAVGQSVEEQICLESRHQPQTNTHQVP